MSNSLFSVIPPSFKILLALIIVFTSFRANSQIEIGPDPSLGVIQLKADPMAGIISPDLLLIHDTWLSQNLSNHEDFQNPIPAATIYDNKVNIEAVSTIIDARQLVEELKAIGLTSPTDYQRIVNGWLPITSIRQMAGLEHLQFVRLAYRPYNRTGSVTTQGDQAQRSDIARTNFTVNGAGLTVGVLSDSHSSIMGGEAADIASGDLPAAGVNNLDNGPAMGSDEGRAMLQIIHDVAPNASLAFHTASGGLAVFASGITDLQTAGCDVIVDDIGYANDAFFQDGVVAQAADAVNAAGISYFSAAGNDAMQSYEGIFANGGVVMVSGFSYTQHDFDTGPGIDGMQSITIPTDGVITLALNWENPFFSISGAPGASADLDLFLFNGAGTAVVATSTAINTGGDANEVLQFQNMGPTANFNIFIGQFSGPIPNMIKWIILGDLLSINEFDTMSATCFAHPNSAGAMAVGAAAWFNTPQFGVTPPVLNNFSSRGGTPILFDIMGNPIGPVIRNKPDFTAPDGGDNTFFGSDIGDPGTFPNFFGTSAAAPHAAGAAALMLDFRPGTTPAQIRSSLSTTAIDITATGIGFDIDSGAGLIDINAAITDLSLLPIELVYFEALLVEKDILLKWQTESETNNHGFEIEMAYEPNGDLTDLDWKFNRFTQGAGTTSTPQNYEERFSDLLPGTYYFRLKQVDIDGNFSYSEVRSATIREDQPIVHAFYDDISEKFIFSLTGNISGEANLQLFDISGKLLVEKNSLSFVNGTTEMPVSNFPKGVYIYRIKIANEFQNGKIVVR